TGGGAVQAVVQKDETRGRDREKDHSAQRLRGTVCRHRCRGRGGFSHGWATLTCEGRSFSSVADNGVRSTPSSPSAFSCTTSLDVITSMTVGVIPPCRRYSFSAAPN